MGKSFRSFYSARCCMMRQVLQIAFCLQLEEFCILAVLG